MDTKSYNIRVPKRWVRTALLAGVLALIVAPLAAVATHSFSDVPDSHTFHADIEWLKDADVTRGCNPPANTRFCPEENVTRGQMAAFMQRFANYLGANDGTPAQADHATTADDADTVGGFEASRLQNSVFIATENTFVNLPGGATTEAQSLELPEGTYLVSASGKLNNNAPTSQGASCSLDVGSDSVNTGANFILGANLQVAESEDFTLYLVTDVASVASASLSCTTTAGFIGNIVRPQIVAQSADFADVIVTGSASSSQGEND